MRAVVMVVTIVFLIVAIIAFIGGKVLSVKTFSKPFKIAAPTNLISPLPPEASSSAK